MKRAALFDMDRTLLRKATPGLWTRYRVRRGEVPARELLRVGWWLFQYTLGVVDAPRVARRALQEFRDREEAELIERCQAWFSSDVLPHVSEVGRQVVSQHQEVGDFVAIVTGATRYAAEPLARELGIDCIVCSELEVVAGRLTGEIVEPLCYARGKTERARVLAEREGFALETATFYTDSVTDLSLLEAVGRPVAVNPDVRLRRIARQRGYEIARWR